VLRPAEVLAPAGTALRVDGQTVVAPAEWQRGGQAITEVWASPETSGAAGKQALDALSARVEATPGARLGGAPAVDADFIDALYGPNLFVIIGAIVLVTMLLLTHALRSIWLPVKALLLNLVSLAAAFGVLTFIWQEGHGTDTLFGSPATGAITLWVPLAVFSLLFGLSMDYEVFILTRINEEHAAGHDTGEAVVRGIGHTGRLVSSGALILFLTFVALGGVPQTDVKILSTGLAAGIILDATIIRGLLAPALVALFGQVNWWLPARVAKLLRTTPLRQGEAAAPAPPPAAPVRSGGNG
jgi:RND superfamily putative drug exporter